jgi:xylulokinase
MRMRNNMATSKLYLGLDFSTQQLKPIVIDDSLSILTEYEDCSVSFDSISKYNTCDGFIEENDTVTAPTLMWVEVCHSFIRVTII